MGATKHEVFSKEINDFAELFKALSHPARLKALMLIVDKEKEGFMTTAELLDKIDLSQLSISRHLKILADTGLIATKVIKMNKTNQQVYRANKETLFALTQILKKIQEYCRENKDESFYSKYKLLNHHFINSYLT
ncbi:MAG: helix-turn-helix domain-containing protein [Crocinitomicaceae bacterium]|nr:helix-turn-helix domain-containing protein [Crocinitomicaceae bacterium]